MTEALTAHHPCGMRRPPVAAETVGHMTQTVRQETAIAEHGIIGDLQTAALVTTDGSIDWFCCPRFDSPSVFGALLDDERGGHFRIRPAGVAYTSEQMYLPDTAVLVTRFFTEGGLGQVVDFMPPAGATAADNHRIVRIVQCVRGRMTFEIDVAPRFDHGRHPHRLETTENGALFAANGQRLTLHVVREPDDPRLAEVSTADGPPREVRPSEVRALFDGTVTFWRSWVAYVDALTRAGRLADARAAFEKMLTYGNHVGLYSERSPSPASRSATSRRRSPTSPSSTPPSPSMPRSTGVRPADRPSARLVRSG